MPFANIFMTYFVIFMIIGLLARNVYIFFILVPRSKVTCHRLGTILLLHKGKCLICHLSPIKWSTMISPIHCFYQCLYTMVYLFWKLIIIKIQTIFLKTQQQMWNNNVNKGSFFLLRSIIHLTYGFVLAGCFFLK